MFPWLVPSRWASPRPGETLARLCQLDTFTFNFSADSQARLGMSSSTMYGMSAQQAASVFPHLVNTKQLPVIDSSAAETEEILVLKSIQLPALLTSALKRVCLQQPRIGRVHLFAGLVTVHIRERQGGCVRGVCGRHDEVPLLCCHAKREWVGRHAGVVVTGDDDVVRVRIACQNPSSDDLVSYKMVCRGQSLNPS